MKVALFSSSFLITRYSNSFFHLVPLLRRGLIIEFTEDKIIVTDSSSSAPLSLDQGVGSLRRHRRGFSDEIHIRGETLSSEAAQGKRNPV